MDENGITVIVSEYERTLSAENAARLAWEDAQAALAFEFMRLTQEAITSGIVDAKTVGDRDRQAALYVGSSQSVALLEEYERNARIKLETASTFRKCYEATFSLTKAVLYAQSGGANFNG